MELFINDYNIVYIFFFDKVTYTYGHYIINYDNNLLNFINKILNKKNFRNELIKIKKFSKLFYDKPKFNKLLKVL